MMRSWLLGLTIAAAGLGGPPATQAQDPDEATATEAAGPGATDDAAPEPADADADSVDADTSHNVAAVDVADDADDEPAHDTGESTAAAPDEEPPGTGAGDDDESSDEAAADEFMTADWAPDVVVDETDDTVPTDRSLDPAGLGWEVIPEPRTAASSGTMSPADHDRDGDYAGPSDILVMRPRAPSTPGAHPASDHGKDTSYSFGGKPIAPGSAPWQAQIYRSLAQPKPGVPRWKAQHDCGGTLIAPDWVLTAAHCVDDIIDDREAGWRVRLGGQDLAREDGVTYAVDRWVRHSGYRNISHPGAPKPPVPPPNMYSNDIALVHIKPDALTRPLADPKRVHPIEIYRKAIKGGDEVTAIGWGMTGNAAKSFSAVPLKVDLRVMDTTTCQARPGYGPERVSGSVICAAREGQKTCRGDSGGPVILTNGTTANLVGLVSWGKSDCSGDGRPSVFTRVETYLAWIDQAMKLPPTRASLP